MSTRRSGLLVAVGVAFAGLAGMGLYRSAAPASPTSVAVVEMTALINDSAEAKSRSDALAKSVEPLKKELKELQDGLDGRRKELEMIPKGSKDYIAKLVEFKKIEAQVEVNSKLYQSVVDLQVGEMHRDLYQSATTAVQRVAKRDGFQLVLLDDRKITFPSNPTQGQAAQVIQSKRIIFTEDSLNITDRVMTEMNNDFNAPAPKGAAGK